jgi:hypothetical protein
LLRLAEWVFLVLILFPAFSGRHSPMTSPDQYVPPIPGKISLPAILARMAEIDLMRERTLLNYA